MLDAYLATAEIQTSLEAIPFKWGYGDTLEEVFVARSTHESFRSIIILVGTESSRVQLDGIGNWREEMHSCTSSLLSAVAMEQLRLSVTAVGPFSILAHRSIVFGASRIPL